MKTMWYRPVILLFASYLTFLSSCENNPAEEDKTDPATANAKIAEAYTEMENIFSTPGSIENKDFSRAERLYMEAVAADPTNPTANFGAAFTRMLGAFADTAIKNTFKRWDGSSVENQNSIFNFGIPSGTANMTVPTALLGKNIVKIIQIATSDPPTITEIQNVLKDRLLPRIDYAIARLAVVEQHQNFELRISGKMQRQPSAPDLYLDLTEVYIMDAMLSGMKAMVEQFLVFKFELNDYSTKSIVQALQQNNTTFFVLAPDGAQRAQNVKSSLLSVVGKIRSGINFLKSESDSQNDDIIKKGTGGVRERDLDTVLVYLNKVESALTGSFSVEIKDADTDKNDYTITISLNNFFNNLPQNPKQAWFPIYTVDTTARGDILWRWQAQDYTSFTFPDPTFSGLFPGMTNETLKRILHIDEAFSWRVDVNINDYNWPPVVETIKLVINGKEYTPKSSYYYGHFYFQIMENNNQPVQIIIMQNGQAIPLEFVGTIPRVRLKHHDYITADIIQAPQNITAQYNQNQNNITVDLKMYSSYRIERSVNNGAFVKIDSLQTSYYIDNNISPSTTYKYRALRGPSYYSWSFMAIRPNNYTNEVSVNVP